MWKFLHFYVLKKFLCHLTSTETNLLEMGNPLLEANKLPNV